MLILFIVLLAHQVAFADEDFFLQILNEMNNNGGLQSPYRCHEQKSIDSKINEKDLLQQCARDLCGSPKEGASAHIVEYNFQQYAQVSSLKKFKEKYEQRIKEKVRERFLLNQERIKRYQKLKEQGKGSINFSHWDDKEYSTMAGIIFLNYQVLSEREKLLKEKTEKFKQGLKSYLKRKEDYTQKQLNPRSILKEEDAYFCTEKECQEVVKEYYQAFNFDKYFEKFSAANNLELMTEEILSNCHSQLAMTSLKSADFKKIKERIPLTLKKVETFLKTFSPESKSSESFMKFMKNIEILYDFDRARSHFPTEDSFYQKIDQELAFKTTTTKSLENIGVWDLTKNFLYMWMGEELALNPLENFSLCSVHPLLSNDGRGEINGKSILNVSLFSALNPEYGEKIFAHEVFHYLSEQSLKGELSLETSEKIKKKKECLKKIYRKGNSSLDSYQKGSTLTLEEEFADLMSTKALKENKKLVICTQLRPTSDGLSYTDLTPKSYRGGHTPVIVRLLLEAIYQSRTLPPSCLEAQKYLENEFDFKANCHI